MIAQIKIRRGTTAEWAAASPVVLADGEPGWDSTLKGMKVGDGSTEWAALPWIDAKNRPDINADTLDGVHLADIRLGQNILHNADFRINQRGVGTGFTTSYQYTLDRWLASPNVWIAIGSTVNLPVYDGAAKFIDQYIEWDLRGKTYTISVDLAGVGIRSVVINYPSDGAAAESSYEGLAMSLVRVGDYDTVRIVNWNAQVEYQIKRVKLELGTVSTLHLDPPMDHAVELPKCQRYFQIRSTNNVSAVDLRPSMRITPTVTGSGPYYYSADL